MTTGFADAPRSSLLRRALYRFADRLGVAERTRPRAPDPHGVDMRGLSQLSDHLLRDIGFVREQGVSLSPTFPHP